MIFKLKNNPFEYEKIIGILLIVFLLLFPLLYNEFHVGLMGKFATFIILALALDLVWGYVGILSMGHGVYFGLGGYILAISYSIQNGVPSFMARFHIEEIPLLMKPLLSIPFSFVLGLIIPGIVAAITGYFIFKGKVSGVYFAIITLAMTVIFQMLVLTLKEYTGGSNGLMGLPKLPIFGEPMELKHLYYTIIFIAIFIYLFIRWLVKKHFGKVLMAISENEDRIVFLRYNPINYKVITYTISASLSGLAGMLFVSINGYFSPTDVGITFSTMLVLWVAVGGRGRLMGAVIGTLFINWSSNTLSETYPEIWQLFIGVIMVVVVVFLPNGIYGTIIKWLEGKVDNKKGLNLSNDDKAI